jgi:hypothetical protein
MSWHAGGTEIVNAIREMRPGDWDASEGEVVDRILVLRPAMRTRRCCGRDLELVVEAERRHAELGPVALQPLRARLLGRAEAAADVGGRHELTPPNKGARAGTAFLSRVPVVFPASPSYSESAFRSVTNLEGVYK